MFTRRALFCIINPMKRVLTPDQIPAEVHELSTAWRKKRLAFEPADHSGNLYAIFQKILAVPDGEWDDQQSLRNVLRQFPKDGTGLYSKSNLIAGYRHLLAEGDIEPEPTIMRRIRMKPMRTQSGVAPVTVLTAPAGCPGQCIFCPDDWRMPKSYIYDEPGAQRAERDGFDPFKQTLGRIRVFEDIGHDASKVELLILGGTWSAYSRDYREWFVRRCLDAMNTGGRPGLRARRLAGGDAGSQRGRTPPQRRPRRRDATGLGDAGRNPPPAPARRDQGADWRAEPGR